MKALHRIPGLEDVKVFKPAYAVEYDYFDPTQLSASLEVKAIEGLFMAGQVNGTTGYEEAAAQGIMAGINAHLKVHGEAPFILGRDSSYIGVLIDDLVTKGVDEPYRMFTSRAEFRILLRQDNADRRLTELSHRLGLASAARYERMLSKYEDADRLEQLCAEVSLRADAVNPYLESVGSTPLSESKRLVDLAARPMVSLSSLLSLVPRGTFDRYDLHLPEGDDLLSQEAREDRIQAAEIEIKYRGYLDRERKQAEKILRFEHLTIPEDFDFDRIQGLTIECRQKMKRYRPRTIAQASRLSGVSPADISVLLLYFGR